MSAVGDLLDFEGETFVAFMDISGFKYYMDNSNAQVVIGDFYQIGYDVIDDFNENNDNVTIGGIFVSDCGILFIRFGGHWFEPLHCLLNVIKDINMKMIRNDHLTTCSIAYGEFNYQRRISNINVRKNPLYGNGYVKAFSDNEYGVPKLKAGECRIVTNGFPPFPREQDSRESILIPPDEAATLNELSLIKSDDGNHYYYYWMLDNLSRAYISDYKERYSSIENDVYKKIKQMIKRYALHM